MNDLVNAVVRIIERVGSKRELFVAVAAAVSLILSFLSVTIWGVDPAWFAILICGGPICWEASVAIVTRGDVKADFLVAIAMAASIYLGEYFAAGEIAFIMALGETLEELATARARSEISNMSSWLPTSVRVVESSGQERETPIEDVEVGDVLRVLPGERIPLDGRILFGESTVDESALTGESIPVEKRESCAVYSGSINLCGSFDMTVEKVEADSSYQQAARMARSTNVDDARFVRLADRWATALVFCSLAIALSVYWATRDLRRAATVLVVFCPCAFVLATPTALLAALSVAARRGVYLKSADVMERLAKVTCVAFDKTGTLTEGRMEVARVRSVVDDATDEDVWDWAAVLEARSEHPIGRAIAASRAKNDALIARVEDFQSSPGRGVRGRIDGRRVCVGSEAFLLANGIKGFEPSSILANENEQSDKGIVFVGVDDRLVGYVATSDRIRESAKRTVEDLYATGRRVVLLSGDSESIVQQVASTLGVRESKGRLLPAEKKESIEELRRSGEVVCMVGDGFNDAPALKSADVGASLGRVGSNLALEASDFVLYRDEIAELPTILTLAQRALRTVKTNLILSTVLNTVGVACAALGLFSPVVGALFHNASSLATILNSLRLLPKRSDDRTNATANKTSESYVEQADLA